MTRLSVALTTLALVAAAVGPIESGAARTRAGGTATYGHGSGGSHSTHYGYYGTYGHYGYSPWAYYGPWGYSVVAADRGDAPAVLETVVRPRRATVTVDGELMGQARDFSGRWDRLLLSPGMRSVELSAPGYRTLTLHLELGAGGYARIVERLERGEGRDPRSTEAPAVRPEPEAPAARASSGTLERGLLRLAVQPGDAAIYLDGEFLARGDEVARLHGAIPVASGTHVVEIVRPGYASVRRTVTVGTSETARLEVDLERE